VKAVYTELHRSHDPQFFLVRGVVKRTTEQPERAYRLLAGLKTGQHELVAPIVFGQGPRARVHSPEYLGFLSEAWDAWVALGDAGPEMIANMHPVRNAATYPTHIVGRLGWHTIDTSCPIGPGQPLPRRPMWQQPPLSSCWTAKTRPTHFVALPVITRTGTLPQVSAF
jgi:acetoin utilization deacetylase AcuC-like enzyme